MGAVGAETVCGQDLRPQPSSSTRPFPCHSASSAEDGCASWVLGSKLGAGRQRQGHSCPHHFMSLAHGHCRVHSRHLPKTG